MIDKKRNEILMGMKGLFGSDVPAHRAYPTSATHNFYLYGPIEDLPAYVDMITILDTAQENDFIHIYLNTPGGEVNTSISIIHAMLRSRANVITHADGQVASAGTLIFFAASMRIVYPYSHFMLHDASGGAIGKVNENIKNVMATSDLIEKLAYDLYCPTFSEDEVDLILEGRDYYCDAEEMYDRIKKCEEEMVEEIEKAQAEVEEDETQDGSDLDTKSVRVNNEKLKSHGKLGQVVEDMGAGKMRVQLDDGKIIYIHKDNLEAL